MRHPTLTHKWVRLGCYVLTEWQNQLPCQDEQREGQTKQMVVIGLHIAVVWQSRPRSPCASSGAGEKWPGRFQVPGRLPGEELRGLGLLSRGGRLYYLSVMLSISNADIHRSSCPHNCFNYVLPPQTEEHLYHFQKRASLVLRLL